MSRSQLKLFFLEKFVLRWKTIERKSDARYCCVDQGPDKALSAVGGVAASASMAAA